MEVPLLARYDDLLKGVFGVQLIIFVPGATTSGFFIHVEVGPRREKS